jgi:hypothetical protein
MTRVALTSVFLLVLVVPASAHHGGGTCDGSRELKLTGTFTGLDLINPCIHAVPSEPVAREFRDRALAIAFLRREGRIHGWDTDELLEKVQYRFARKGIRMQTR